MIFLIKQYLVKMLHKSMDVFPRTARRRQFIPTKVYTADMRCAEALVLHFIKINRPSNCKKFNLNSLGVTTKMYWNNIQATIL